MEGRKEGRRPLLVSRGGGCRSLLRSGEGHEGARTRGKREKHSSAKRREGVRTIFQKESVRLRKERGV